MTNSLGAGAQSRAGRVHVVDEKDGLLLKPQRVGGKSAGYIAFPFGGRETHLGVGFANPDEG